MPQQFFDETTVVEKGHGRRLPQVTIEQILHLGPHLGLADRALLQAVYEQGMSVTAIARAAGQSPRALRARLRRLVQRLNSPAFKYAARHSGQWPDDRRTIAQAVILRGNTQRATARLLNTSVYHVRREIDRIQAQSEAADRK